ncbi:hypothetical protein SCOR_32450 [Sulfidibacter corallicola]|nr:hypothetical protein [Sulfidibacter corallicola]
MNNAAVSLAEQNEALQQALARKDAQIAALDQHIGLLEEQLRL